MRAILRTVVSFGVIAVSLLAPPAASAITLDQVVALARAGVTDTVILAMIDRDRTIFAIEPEQIVGLQRDGLSEKIVLALLKSGREEGELAARADAAYNSAWIAATMPTEPLTVTVGHGPERPNRSHIDGFYSGTLNYPPSYRDRAASSSRSPRRFNEPRALCYAQISTQNGISQRPFVTECPAVMQPRWR